MHRMPDIEDPNYKPLPSPNDQKILACTLREQITTSSQKIKTIATKLIQRKLILGLFIGFLLTIAFCTIKMGKNGELLRRLSKDNDFEKKENAKSELAIAMFKITVKMIALETQIKGMDWNVDVYVQKTEVRFYFIAFFRALLKKRGKKIEKSQFFPSHFLPPLFLKKNANFVSQFFSQNTKN